MKISEWVQVSPMPKLNDAIVVNESCLILPDVELPYQHSEFINKCIFEAQRRKIETAIFAGDFWHLSSLAHFAASEKKLTEEIDAVGKLISGFLDAFKKIKRFKGNHDARVEKAFDRILPTEIADRLMLSPNVTARWNAKVETSSKYWCWVGEGENRWRIIHPKSTNSVPANAARRIAEKWDCNVAMAHDHLVGLQQTQDGKHFGLEIGCCVDPERLAYVQERDVTRPQMKLGALILERHGEQFYPTLLSEGLTWWGK